MVIVQLSGGLGNQFYQYALGRCLAYKLNTELKLDLSRVKVLHGEKPRFHNYYRMGKFNIQENIATPEEIKYVMNNGVIPPHLTDLKSFQGDVFVKGDWMFDECYFADVIDIIRKEFTLKKPFSLKAEEWRKKILSAKCSVSLHIRHGDKVYNPYFYTLNKAWTVTLPLDYYSNCIDILKQKYKNITAFVFTDDLPWVKENLHLDVPTEFIEGCDTDDEDFILMTLCDHNIIANSTFSRCAASLNANPNKKIFRPVPFNAEKLKQYLAALTPVQKKAILASGTWIGFPCDYGSKPDNILPYFSLLLVVNDDIATLSETLDSILGQEYRYYEVIIIDNASTDGSNKICHQVAKARDNVTLIELQEKISIGAAWNMALDRAQGKFVLFLKGNDKIFPDALTSLYPINERVLADVVDSVHWVKESERGNIDIADKKFVVETNKAFLGLQGNICGKFDKPTLFKIFAANDAATPLATKVFQREFLMDNEIRFNEKIGKEAERLFMVNAMLQADEMIFTPNMHYIAPRK